MPIEKQRKIAKETLDVFVPLANKLGVWELKTELEDMSFRVLHPQEHAAITYLMKNRMDLIKDLQTTRQDVTVDKVSVLLIFSESGRGDDGLRSCLKGALV